MFGKRTRKSEHTCTKAKKMKKKSNVPKPIPLKLRLPQASFAKPTFTHMAIRVLVEQGYVRHVISQNVDGLHMRSGLKREKLSELHGNLFIEQCIACGFNVLRTFDVAETTARSQHYTGRICPQCSVSRPMESLLARGILDNAARKLASSKQKSKPSRENVMLCYRQAARKLARSFESIRIKAKQHIPSIIDLENASIDEHILKTAPLLRDVVVHFFEKQPEMGLSEIYRIQSAIEAVHGRKPLHDAIHDTQIVSKSSRRGPRKRIKVENSNHFSNSLWFKRMCPALRSAPLNQYDLNELDNPSICLEDNSETPARLIIVIGSSLNVLRNYQFLWPYGLGRCLRHTDSRPRPTSNILNGPLSPCRLVIVNLQPTCKDGVADLVLRVPCDDLFRTLMIDHLKINVPQYNAICDDPLYYQGIALTAQEEATRTRPDIPLLKCDNV